MDAELGFLGGGHMGWAVLEAVLDGGVATAGRTLLVDHHAACRDRAQARGCLVHEDASALSVCDTLVLAIRPQDFDASVSCLHEDRSRLAISLMAGIESDRIARVLGPGTRVVRAMPNAPAAIGVGMTGLAAGVGATQVDLDHATALFDAVGRTVHVREDQLHAVTAVSGSGPAWYFLLSEAILEQALALGLDPPTAEALVRGTLEGAAALMSSCDTSPGELRESVTTRGGTTEAGLAAMCRAGLPEAARAGVEAACRRGQELAKA